jgi:hypothetical protein
LACRLGGANPGQRILVVQIDAYAWLAPYVENDDEIFLKSIIPGRKATKHYLKGGVFGVSSKVTTTLTSVSAPS